MFRLLSVTSLLLAVACVNTADASLAIRLDDGAGNIVVVTDNGAGDTNATLGAVSYSGPLGTSPWTVNVTTGIGTPVLGTPNLPNIDLNSVNVTTSGAGTLHLAVSQTGNLQSSNPLAFTLAAGGVIGGTYSGAAYASSSNLLFDTTGAGAVQLGSTLTSGGGAFSGTTTGAAPGVTTGIGQYSLTVTSTIVHAKAGVSSFDAELQAVPEPTSFAAWSLVSMLGMGLVWFKRRRS